MRKITKFSAEINLDDFYSGQYDIIILSNYFGIDKLPALINSPLHTDDKPSFGLQYYNDRVLWKDFSTNESGNIISLLCRMWNLSYIETVTRIANELNLGTVSRVSTDLSYKIKHSNCDIRIHSIPFQEQHINYWNKYGISEKQCKYVNVFAIDYFWVNRQRLKSSDLAFAYAEPYNNIIKYKIYQPYNTKYKWVNGFNSNIISLITKIPKTGKHLIIAASLKDALCIWCNTKVPAIAFQSEVNNIKPEIVTNLKQRFDNVYICYDNDETGIFQADKKAKELNLNNIIIPQFEDGKDISDYYVYNPTLMKDLIKSNLIL
ncbi:MAG: toprim domain-containing protein [Bacilli bacterium]|nr:toprim domain-containing protein [Bacilli bacterium]